jgi:hypothetical protein
MLVYSASEAAQYIYYNHDGFLGLGIGTGFQENDDRKPNVVEQLVSADVIDKKIIGVHTYLQNTTDAESSVRFGGVNQDLIRKHHEIRYMDTVAPDTWQIPLSQVAFMSDELLAQPSKALINPGYPFIGMPTEQFDAFQRDIASQFAEGYFYCSDWDWCFMFDPCDKVVKELKPLVFTLGKGDTEQTYEVPPSQFMIEEYDAKF